LRARRRVLVGFTKLATLRMLERSLLVILRMVVVFLVVAMRQSFHTGRTAGSRIGQFPVAGRSRRIYGDGNRADG
jgi:hypothetical protein